MSMTIDSIRWPRQLRVFPTTRIIESVRSPIILFTSMPRTTRSIPCIGDIPRVVALPLDLHGDETHEGEFSEASEQFSDEDSDYGNCAWGSVFRCICTYNFFKRGKKERSLQWRRRKMVQLGSPLQKAPDRRRVSACCQPCLWTSFSR